MVYTLLLLNFAKNETGIFRGTLISRFGQKYILKGTKFREIVKILICINKHSELVQLILIFHNNCFQRTLNKTML